MKQNRKGTDSYYLGFPDIFRVFSDISDYLSKNNYQEPEQVLSYILSQIAPLVNARAGTIGLYDSETNHLVLKADCGISKKHRENKSALPVGNSIAGAAFEREEVIAVDDLRKEKRYVCTEYPKEKRLRSLVSVPLVTPERKMGVISFYYAGRRHFSEQQVEFFTSLSSILAASVASYLLHHQLLHSYLDTVEALVLTLEERIGFSEGHSERVRDIAVKIAREMELSEEKIELLSRISVLHDIGKMLIDASILHKNDELSEDEWKAIKQHPVIGSDMLSPLNLMSPVFPLIKYHHERVDGRGYPDGLTGGEIPLIARIICVADSFDAMLSERPYREALTAEKAREELKENAGKQFDPEVVKVLLQLIQSGKVLC